MVNARARPAEHGYRSYPDAAKAQRAQARARTELARRSLAEFVQQQWHLTQGTKPLFWTTYLQAICDEMQLLLEGWLVANGKANPRQRARVIAAWERHGLEFQERALLVQNEIFNLAPSTLKSTIIMVCAPAWMWLHDPSVKFGCSSANDDNVKRDSNAHRELVSSAWYRGMFGIKWRIKRGRADAVQRWEITGGGERLSRTWLAGFTGIHVDVMLMDDPDDAKKVWSEATRKETHNQFTNAMESRVVEEKLSLRVVSQQRTHVDDMSGYLKTLKPWAPDTPESRLGWASFIVPMRAGHQPKEYHESPFGFRDPRVLLGEAAIAHVLERAAANENVRLRKYPEPGATAREHVPVDEARAIAAQDPTLIYVPRVGELMHRERFDEVSLKDKIWKLGSHGVAAQYDQNPEVIDGGMFPRRFWRFFRVADALPGQPGFSEHLQPADPRPRPDGFPDETEAPAFVLERNRDGTLKLDWLTITVDSTFGSLDPSTASNVGLLVVGGQGLRRFIFHDGSMPRKFLDCCGAIKDLLRRYPARRVLIELKANGSSVIDSLRKDVEESKVLGPNGKPIIVVVDGIEPGGESKVSRAQGMLHAVEAGLWYLLEGAHWIEEFGAEVCVFPNSRRDDRVDAMSQLAWYYSDENDAVQRAIAMNRW